MSNKSKSKYNSVSEWRKVDILAYKQAVNLGLLDRIHENFGWAKKKPHNYWTLERCKEDALKYKSKKEWQKNSGGVYKKAREKKWLHECCKHMIGNRNGNGHWSLENCKSEALKYNSRMEWKLKSSPSYSAAVRAKLVNECCTHMSKIRNEKGFWTLEECKKDALKYKTRTEWQESHSAYLAAYRNEWLDECCAHMK
jgi:hypothetical protein